MASNLPAHQRGDEYRKLFASPAVLAQVAAAAPKHIRPEYLTRTLLTAFLKLPQLLECSKESILLALMKASEMGLPPDGRKSAILPFNGTAQWIPMYQGLMELARRSDKILSFHAAAVYEKDIFEYELGLHPKLTHKPYRGDDAPGPVVAAYAVAQVVGQTEPTFRVVPRRDIERARKSSPSVKRNKTSPWDDWYDEMAIKTAILRLCKWLPQTPELTMALEAEEAQYLGEVNPPRAASVASRFTDTKAEEGPAAGEVTTVDGEEVVTPTGVTVACPNKDGRDVDTSECETTCPDRLGCPAHG